MSETSGETAGGEEYTVSQVAARQANMAFILDGSGSMMAELPGTGKSKLAVAKEVMAQLIPQVPEGVNGALWAYGHRLPEDPKEESCEDIENVFALGPIDPAAYMAKINAITGRGYTPISDSLLQAASSLPAGDFNNIILVSDGIETCEGDPCAVAKALKESDASITIHVVGYAVDDDARKQLQCIAEASGGTYHDASDADSLLEALDTAIAAAVVETILRVEVIGSDGEQLHANPRLYEPGTKKMIGGYSSWVDNPVPPGTYDLGVDTVPPYFYPGLTIEEGSRVVIVVGMGTVQVLTPDGQDAGFDIYNARTGERLGHYQGSQSVISGPYQVTVIGTTAPFTVEAGQVVQIQLGAVQVLAPDGTDAQFEIFDWPDGQRLGSYKGTLPVVPGSYQVKLIGTGEPLTVEAGQVVQTRLASISAPGSFTIFDGDGTRLGYYGPSLDVMPGTYSLELEDGRTVDGLELTPSMDLIVD